MDVRRHVRGAHHRQHPSVGADPVARDAELRPRGEQSRVLHPEARRHRARVPGGIGGRHLGVVEARGQRGGRAQGQDAGSHLAGPEELHLARVHLGPRAVADADTRAGGDRLAGVRRRPAQDDSEGRRVSRLDRRAHEPRIELHRALESTLHRLADRRRVEAGVGGRQHPARPLLGPAQPVDLQERAEARHALSVEDVDERAHDAVARPGRPTLARQVLARGEPYREGPRLLRLDEGAVPLAAGRGAGLHGAAVRRRVELVRGPDQELVRVGGLPRAEHRRPLLLPHRLVEGRPAQDDQPAALLHEVADRRPRLERERAAVGQHQDVVVGALQAGGQGGRRIDGVDRKARQRRRQGRVVDRWGVGRREAGRAKDRGARRPRGIGDRRGGAERQEQDGQHEGRKSDEAVAVSRHGPGA